MNASDVRRIKQKFMNSDPICWWGDHIDVRFQLVKNLKKLKGKKILEVGCNNGVILSEIEEENDCYGFDISAQYVQKARRVAAKSKIRVASMYECPYKNNFFDVVIWANVVPGADFFEPAESVERLRRLALLETIRVLKKGGKIYLTTPNNARYVSNKLSYNELIKLVNPFNDVKICGWNPFPSYPYFLPSRVLCKLPNVFELLEWMMHRRTMFNRCKMFYVEARK